MSLVYVLVEGAYDALSIAGIYATPEAAMAAHPDDFWERSGDGWWNGRNGDTTTASIEVYELQGEK